ncbi:hypothetical protein BJ742DRAFT_810091 [Cladochytrium replicatum]|nr:hypothetical protein BJ742DRAFT_810091 [Cladochytrium replicatum]
MRLLTHNLLQCHVKACAGNNNFPLKIEDAELENSPDDDVEVNLDFARRLLTKIDWPALVATAYALGLDVLPQEKPSDDTEDQEILTRIHRILLQTRIKNGKMVCPNCAHVYPIKDFVPNMLLHDSEV